MLRKLATIPDGQTSNHSKDMWLCHLESRLPQRFLVQLMWGCAGDTTRKISPCWTFGRVFQCRFAWFREGLVLSWCIFLIHWQISPEQKWQKTARAWRWAGRGREFLKTGPLKSCLDIRRQDSNCYQHPIKVFLTGKKCVMDWEGACNG